MFLMKDILGTGGVGGPRSHPQNGGVRWGWGVVGLIPPPETPSRRVALTSVSLIHGYNSTGSKKDQNSTPPTKKTQNKKFNH